jgi:hypothetical protein
MTVITNNVPRDILDASDLTLEERKEFDYLDWSALEEGTDSASFFRYRGQIYDLGEFSSSWGIMREGSLPVSLKGWDGYITDTFFSGIVVRYVTPEFDTIIVGRMYS